MKIAQKLFAALIAVLLIAAMVVPFAADTIPTTDNSVTVAGKNGFTASLYKIADFDVNTGEFSNAKSTAVQSALEAGFTETEYNPNAALLTAANGLTFTAADVIKSKAFTGETSVTWDDIPAGAYYVKWTWDKEVVKNVKKAQNSVFVLPYYQNSAWQQSVSIPNSKIETSEVSFSKKFAAPEDNADVVNRSIDEPVDFVLKGSVPGSTEKPATALSFNDDMTGGGLVYQSGLVVKADGTTLTAGTDYTLDPASVGDIEKAFTVSFTPDQILALYDNEYTEIEIDFTAQLTSDNVVIGGNGNPNTLTYSYTNEDGTFTDTMTKIVKTFEFKVKKVDANNTSTVLGGAKFKLFDSNGTQIGDEKETPSRGDDKGFVTFSGLKDGTYKVVETVAPAGYALNTKEFTVTIGADGSVTGDDVDEGVLTVPDPKVVLPNTGGAGTLLFTIGGIILIAGAAVLFVIYKKKAASK